MDPDLYSSPVPVRDESEKRGPAKPDAPSGESALWSSAKRQSFSAMKTNPNAYFYRHVAPGQAQQTGPWSEREKRLFLEAVRVHPPSGGQWGLFARHIPGRVGYQCRNFYHRLLETGELRALPGEPRAAKHARGRKPRAAAPTDDEAPAEPSGGAEAEAAPPQENAPREEPPPDAPAQQPEAAGFEAEASRVLRANKDNPQAMLLFFPPGGEDATTEYLGAVWSHLVRDSQADKQRLVAAYFEVTQTPEASRAALARDFVSTVLRSVH
jgi:hypothetical protein